MKHLIVIPNISDTPNTRAYIFNNFSSVMYLGIYVIPLGNRFFSCGF